MYRYKERYWTRTHIYIMHSATTGYFKIGLSIHPEKRVQQIRWYVPDVELVDFVHADAIWEQELHRRFRDQRVYGEWFTLKQEQLSNLRELFAKKREWNARVLPVIVANERLLHVQEPTSTLG